MKKKHQNKSTVSSKKNGIKKTVLAHVKKDMEDFKKEIADDKSLMKKLEKKPKDPKKDPKPKKSNKIKIVMEEFHEKKLRSGSKNGPIVTNPAQAVAIGYSEQRKENKKRKKRGE